jgi:hypothetical protein
LAAVRILRLRQKTGNFASVDLPGRIRLFLGLFRTLVSRLFRVKFATGMHHCITGLFRMVLRFRVNEVFGYFEFRFHSSIQGKLGTG